MNIVENRCTEYIQRVVYVSCLCAKSLHQLLTVSDLKMALKVQYQLLVTLGERFGWLGVVLGTIAKWRVVCKDSTLLIKEVEGIITL